jgi:hypothetical protein
LWIFFSAWTQITDSGFKMQVEKHCFSIGLFGCDSVLR